MSTPEFSKLTTEQQNPASLNIDTLPTGQMLAVINAADAEIATAVAGEIENIALAVDHIAHRLSNGGRLFYTGAGTSGRLGVLDASECPPTFNSPPDLVQGLIAGGDHALRHAVERAEDNESAGAEDLAAHGFSALDALVGIAASGRTPYVLGSIRYARNLGATTVALSCAEPSAIAQAAEFAITPVVGPEIITGSTRMRAGTATKMVLNMISTGVMIRLGYIYSNLMVNVQPTNDKLLDRACRIVAAITDVDYHVASGLLSDAGGSVRVAIVMQRLKVSRIEAEHRLSAAKQSLRAALES